MKGYRRIDSHLDRTGIQRCVCAVGVCRHTLPSGSLLLPGIPARGLAEGCVQTLARIPVKGTVTGSAIVKAVYGRSGSSFQKCRITGPVGYRVDCPALSQGVYLTIH